VSLRAVGAGDDAHPADSENADVDWQKCDRVRVQLRLMVKRILREHKYPPKGQAGAVTLGLARAEELSRNWIENSAGQATARTGFLRTRRAMGLGAGVAATAGGAASAASSGAGRR